MIFRFITEVVTGDRLGYQARRFIRCFRMMAHYLALLLALALLSSVHAAETRFFRIVGPQASTFTAFSADGYVTWTSGPANATFTIQAASSLLSPTNWVDYLQVPTTNPVTIRRLYDPNPPSGMALIPAGPFTMGDSLDGLVVALPLRYVYVSAFYMDQYEVTKTLWDGVYAWAVTHGYGFDRFDGGPQGKANHHPVHYVSWYDCVKWCNARSEMEGRTPAYYKDAALAVRFRTGPGEGQVYVNWSTGYRLPTEAEWEKAARGGASGQRFPWGERISQSQANHYAYPLGWGGWDYDANLLAGYHPTFDDGTPPFTSPVGYFAPNGYGLYDMIGNLWEWCGDAFSSTYYSSSPGIDPVDPRGPTDIYPGTYPGTYPVMRGGAWNEKAYNTRTASRGAASPMFGSLGIGFRSVLPSGQF